MLCHTYSHHGLAYASRIRYVCVLQNEYSNYNRSVITHNPNISESRHHLYILRSYESTVYPKKYAHGFCFAVLCCGYTLTDFPISIRLTSLALWQSNDCPSASKATLMNMDKYFMWIHYERLHNHNKAKHNKTVCIFLGIYCILRILWEFPLNRCQLNNQMRTPAYLWTTRPKPWLMIFWHFAFPLQHKLWHQYIGYWGPLSRI